MKKFFKILGIIILLLVAVIGGLLFKAHEKLPIGIKGEKAEALAKKMIQAVNKTAWDSTAFVSWSSRSGYSHLWDKQRNLAQVEWKNNRVLLDVHNKSGKAWENQQAVTDAKLSQELIEKAYKSFINDAFWLNPIVKIFDEGTERSLVTQPDGSEALLVSYASGGVTPGDAYLWKVDAQGLPTAWQLWVKIIPIGGVEFSWEDWVTLPSGAKIAVGHKEKSMGLSTPLTNLKSGARLADIGVSADIFSAIQ
jgi:hypothetical protein